LLGFELGIVLIFGSIVMFRKLAILSLLVISPIVASAMHHEVKNTKLSPPAAPGQLVVVYEWSCPEDKANEAISIINELIVYERKASPIDYSSVAGSWTNGKIGAIDIHLSAKSLAEVQEWQASDVKWSGLLDKTLKICGITESDLTTEILNVR
jgi:hypothetical protein